MNFNMLWLRDKMSTHFFAFKTLTYKVGKKCEKSENEDPLHLLLIYEIKYKIFSVCFKLILEYQMKS